MPYNKKSPSIFILNGRARLYPPTDTYKSWRIYYKDPVTGKPKTVTGGTTRELAEAKASQILGDYIDPQDATKPPLLADVVESWLEQNRHKWSERTRKGYESIARKYLLQRWGGTPITQIGPEDMRKIDTSNLGRAAQERLAYVVKSVFEQGSNWFRRDPKRYGQNIKITGTKASEYKPRVSRGDIPSGQLVASWINTAYSSFQLSPLDDPATVHVDLLTGVKTRTKGRVSMGGLGLVTPMDDVFLNGLPADKYYTVHNRLIEDRFTNEYKLAYNAKTAMMWRNAGLVTAIGAGDGLRIGEVLALRVRHFLTREQVVEAFVAGVPREQRSYRGEINVYEQASSIGGKQIFVGLPKMRKTRTVHSPYYLPHWDGEDVGAHRKLVAAVIPRFADINTSFWTSTNEEAITLWKNGFIPLGWLIWNRLEELWNEPAINIGKPSLKTKINNYLDLLVFPSKQPPRKSNKTSWEDSFPYGQRLVPGTGSYQAASNYNLNYQNRLFDYVTEFYNIWPEHRANSSTRKGWTHHGLRHYAASWRIQAGVPLTTIAAELGHKSAAFTLERYGHMIPIDIDDRGFEF